MEKHLKDYAPFYIGCECQLFWEDEDGKLEYERNGILEIIRPENEEQYGLGFRCKTKKGNHVPYNYPYSGVKLILRPLKNMTNEEKNEVEWSASPSGLRYSPKSFIGLLSKHFDLFGLIEAGLAIDKTKIY